MNLTNFIKFTAILLIVAGGLPSCGKENDSLQMGLYERIDASGGDPLKINFIDQETLIIIWPKYKGVQYQNEYKYKILSRKIRLMSGEYSEELYFRIVNHRRFEIECLNPWVGFEKPPNMVFQKIKDNN